MKLLNFSTYKIITLSIFASTFFCQGAYGALKISLNEIIPQDISNTEKSIQTWKNLQDSAAKQGFEQFKIKYAKPGKIWLNCTEMERDVEPLLGSKSTLSPAQFIELFNIMWNQIKENKTQNYISLKDVTTIIELLNTTYEKITDKFKIESAKKELNELDATNFTNFLTHFLQQNFKFDDLTFKKNYSAQKMLHKKLEVLCSIFHQTDISKISEDNEDNWDKLINSLYQEKLKALLFNNKTDTEATAPIDNVIILKLKKGKELLDIINELGKKVSKRLKAKFDDEHDSDPLAKDESANWKTIQQWTTRLENLLTQQVTPEETDDNEEEKRDRLAEQIKHDQELLKKKLEAIQTGTIDAWRDRLVQLNFIIKPFSGTVVETTKTKESMVKELQDKNYISATTGSKKGYSKNSFINMATVIFSSTDDETKELLKTLKTKLNLWENLLKASFNTIYEGFKNAETTSPQKPKAPQVAAPSADELAAQELNVFIQNIKNHAQNISAYQDYFDASLDGVLDILKKTKETEFKELNHKKAAAFYYHFLLNVIFYFNEARTKYEDEAAFKINFTKIITLGTEIRDVLNIIDKAIKAAPQASDLTPSTNSVQTLKSSLAELSASLNQVRNKVWDLSKNLEKLQIELTSLKK